MTQIILDINNTDIFKDIMKTSTIFEALRMLTEDDNNSHNQNRNESQVISGVLDLSVGNIAYTAEIVVDQQRSQTPSSQTTDVEWEVETITVTSTDEQTPMEFDNLPSNDKQLIYDDISEQVEDMTEPEELDDESEDKSEDSTNEIDADDDLESDDYTKV